MSALQKTKSLTIKNERGDSKRNKRFPEEREQQGYHRYGLWISLRRSISMREALHGVEDHLHRVKSHRQQP